MARNRGRRLAHPLPLPKDTVLCGELTLDPSQPHNNVLPFPSDVPLDIRWTVLRDIETTHTTVVGAEFWAQLMTFLKAQAQALHLEHVKINVPHGTKYLVRNSEVSFKQACGKQDVRAWLEEHVIDEGRKAAMIVGMYTYSNATYVHTHDNQLGGKVSASDHTNAASAGVGAGAAAFSKQAFNMPEEQIFAIEYKPVRFKPWTKKKVKEAKLEDGPNRWEVFLGHRTKGAATDQKENIFEFDFDDDDGDDELDDMEGEEEGQDATTSMKFEGSNIDEI